MTNRPFQSGESTPVHYLGLAEVGRLLQQRRISAEELARQMLQRIERVDPVLKSYATVTADLAIEQARAADREIAARRYRGPLHGVPIALKDLCFTRGIRTAAGTLVHGDFVPDHDGTIAERLARAGAVLLGKLQLTEGAFTDHHPAIPAPVNPWHADHWSGASSSGSGVATAAGLCFASIGSDTGGSIRFPSAANGVTGLKPTWGRVSRYGSFALAPSLDHFGPMCRSALDCGIVLDAIAGPDPRDPTASQAPTGDYMGGEDRSLRGVRIGIDERYISEGVDAEMTAAMGDVLRALKSLGADPVPVVFPPVEQAIADWGPNCAIEAAVAHERSFPSRSSLYGPGLSGFLTLGRSFDAMSLHRILMRRREFSGRVDALFEGIDLLLIPSQCVASPTVERMRTLGEDAALLAGLVRFTAPFDMTGSPTLTMPFGWTSRGTPIAFQLVARHWREDALLRAGRAYQRETDWHLHFPRH